MTTSRLNWYRGVLIQDDSQPDNLRLRDFVDTLEAETRGQLISALQHGGVVTLTWKSAIPLEWDRRHVHVEFRDESFDEWTVENIPFGRFRPVD
ncbi:hypothetical protein GC207_13650 [bacterium]|nr:hypothetical protein [bacterium]